MSQTKQSAEGILGADGEPAQTDPTSSSSGRKPSDTPYSPRPRLFDGLPLPDGPQASDVLTDADYRRMRTQAFSARSVLPPLLGSAAIGYFSPRLFRTKPASVGIVRTGMFTLSLALSLSYTTFSHLSQAIASARHKAVQAALPRTEDGQVILPSGSVSRDTYALPEPIPVQTLANQGVPIDADLARLGRIKDRTRWAKGKGLVGEVEEEAEMRDTFFRPGTPRRDG